MGTKVILITACLFFMALLAVPRCFCQDTTTLRQIDQLEREKQARTAVEKKIDSRLLQAIRAKKGVDTANGLHLRPQNIGMDGGGNLAVDINATINDSLLQTFKTLGVTVIFSSVRFHSIRARLNLSVVEDIAGYDAVSFIKPASLAKTQ